MEIVILGGGYAGIACATRLARLARGQPGPARIRLVNPRPVLVERIRLHQAATGQSLRERRIDRLLARAGVELVTGWAEAIDCAGQTVRVGHEQLRWDRLVLALGSHAGAHDVPGVREHAFALEAEAAPVLHARLAALPQGARVAVVGGGLTGIEAASELAEAFPLLQVHLVSRTRLAPEFSQPARDYLRFTLAERLGVRLHEETDVQAVEAAALRTPGGSIGFDLCVWAAGFRLPALPREAGLRVNAHGQVLVDPALRSVSHPAVYAAGDVAVPLLAPGQALPMGCKTALPMGAHAGENLARELQGRPGVAFDHALMFYCVSLGRHAGLIQWADGEGRLQGRTLTGRRGALFKEMICRMTWWSLVGESRGRRMILWKSTGRAPAQLPGRQPALP